MQTINALVRLYISTFIGNICNMYQNPWTGLILSIFLNTLTAEEDVRWCSGISSAEGG